jgi:DNA-binding MarR family transcriptional regulator
MVRITAEGRRTRKQLDALMRERTNSIMASIPAKEQGHILRALKTLNNAIEAAGYCGLNTPVAKLTRIEEANE